MRLRPRKDLRWLALAAAALLLLASGWLLVPAPVPTYDAVRAAWRPSEAWLVDRLADHAMGNHRRGRVVAILGGSGGAGASVLATGLAVTARRRWTPASRRRSRTPSRWR